jgi:hypothetical protein
MTRSERQAMAEFPSLDQLRDEFSRLAERPAPRVGWPVRAPRLRTAALAGCVAIALGLASLTPPGRAVATDLGQLVGIGDEPTQGVPEGEHAVVIGTGDTAKSYRYEVVAETNNGGTDRSETCVFLEFPDLQGHEAGNCLTDASRRSLPEEKIDPLVYAAEDEFRPDAELIVQGLATPDVARVLVSYPSSDGVRTEAPVEMSTLDDQLSRQIGVEDQAGFFFAFLPEGVLQGEPDDPRTLTPCSVKASLGAVELAAFDAAGNQVATLDLGDGVDARVLLLIPPSGFESPFGGPPDIPPDAPGHQHVAPEPYPPGCSGG